METPTIESKVSSIFIEKEDNRTNDSKNNRQRPCPSILFYGMHIKIPQSTNHGHQDKHSEKISRFLQKSILNSLKKGIHSSKNIFRKKLYYKYV